ncbi:uncharacterized protein LOC131344990 [Hemibagrus wyckioides]|uniref:uncharacterized protein LOC131344990 n=1 Tax=Hemibagrus wyckioides TaxID=337641 RepID=UPI00266CB677|nr:uncharacterized protein LOC131344990 [Hemibagrus wyckioides]
MAGWVWLLRDWNYCGSLETLGDDCLTQRDVEDITKRPKKSLRLSSKDRDPEEGLQEPGGEGSHHIAPDEDHRVRTTSHVPERNRMALPLRWPAPKHSWSSSPLGQHIQDIAHHLTVFGWVSEYFWQYSVGKEKEFPKFGLLNIRSLAPKTLIINEMISDYSFDTLCLTETWLRSNEYIGLNESTPSGYSYKHEPRQIGRGVGVATIYNNSLTVTQKTGPRFNSFEVVVLNVALSDRHKKSLLSLALATVYKPPGPYGVFLNEFSHSLSDILISFDKVLIVGDFNIHVDKANDALGLAFIDLLNFFGVKQNINSPTHRFTHTLDLVISHGTDVSDITVLPQSDDITDHHLLVYTLPVEHIRHISPRYKLGRTITPTTKDRFTNNLPDLSQLLTRPLNADALDEVTNSIGTIFTSTLDTVAPIRLKKVRVKTPAPRYNSHTHALKRATRNLERKWRKTKLPN